jgi:membrane protein involved in colicin uptake
VWPLLVQRVAAADVRELDEAAQLYLLHAAMQEAARAAAAAAAASGGGGSSVQANSSSGGGSGSNGGGSGSSLSAPRATREEVEQLVGSLPKKMRTRVMAAYQVGWFFSLSG